MVADAQTNRDVDGPHVSTALTFMAWNVRVVIFHPRGSDQSGCAGNYVSGTLTLAVL